MVSNGTKRKHIKNRDSLEHETLRDYEALIEAGRNGDVKSVRRYLSKPSIDVNNQTWNAKDVDPQCHPTYTPLMAIVSCPNVDSGLMTQENCDLIVQEFIETGVDLDTVADEVDIYEIMGWTFDAETPKTNYYIISLIKNNPYLDQQSVSGFHWYSPNAYAGQRLFLKSSMISILQSNGDNNPVGYKGNYALHTCANGNPYYVDLLLKTNIDVNVRNDFGMTALHIAVPALCEHSTRILCEKGADINASDKDGNTPLHLAAESTEAVEILVEHKANVNAVNKLGRTALHLACLAQSTEVVEMLLAAECDGAMVDSYGVTPMRIAVRNEDTEVITLLTDSGLATIKSWSEHAELFDACEANDVDYVKTFIKSDDADVNVFNCDGKTPLHIACLFGFTDIIQLLLSAGAEIGLRDDLGRTCFNEACDSDSETKIEVIKQLISYGVDVNCRDAVNATPFQRVCGLGKVDVAKLLIQSKAVVNVVDDYNNTPLTQSCLSNKTEVVKLLVEHDIDTLTVNNSGQSLLHIICNSERINDEMLNYILEKTKSI